MLKRVIIRLMKKGLNVVHKTDARNMEDFIDPGTIDVTISSPPYFNLKDYGHKKQIGFGQSYDTYLNDIGEIFGSVYKLTKQSGSLWIIVDTFKKGGEVFPLPFDIANELKKKGWILQDIIIWSKERTVPWAQKGQTRSMFEYILVFSKTTSFTYHVDRIRDFQNLKKWWVKYPERYNPKGKAPSEIWIYDIPTQGSWGNGYVKHFCPLPERLVQRIIELTTDQGDVVFDPFSGSGTVPSQTLFMKRNYIGFELNSKYINLFKKYIKDFLKEKVVEYERSQGYKKNQQNFEKLIINLRILKLGGQILKKLTREGVSDVTVLYTERLALKTSESHKLAVAKYIFVVKNKSSIARIKKKIAEYVAIPPLSKYGIEAKFEVVAGIDRLDKYLHDKNLYNYSANSTYKYTNVLNKKLEYGDIISPIKVSVDEKDYE